MAATAALSTAAATVVVLGGITVYYLILQEAIYANVSPETRRIYESLGELDAAPSEATKEVNDVLRSMPLYHLEGAVWFCLILAGVAVGALIGAYWGGRVARPIEGVARAAAAINDGDLAARAPSDVRLRGEPAQLVANFNLLAEGLEEAERELTGSASAIAHELRTPVTILRARLQAVRDGVFPLSPQELDGLIAQADLMTAVIEDMRILSLAGARQFELNLQRVNLAQEAVSVITTTSVALAAAGVQVETDLPETLAVADPARVRQVLNALLDNARRYAAHGGVVRIETKSNAGRASLLVLDRGPGLPDEGDAKSMFDRFWRGEPSRARETGGTGLGLAVVKAIAEAHGGEARAFNRSGGGAGFEVTFPSA